MKYFRDEQVVQSEKTLLEFAADHSKIPIEEEFRCFSNDLLVRLAVKNGKRSEIFLKMDNKEFVEARRQGIWVHRFSQADQEGADGRNVFDLGGDLGRWRIDSDEVDPETTRPSELEGVLVQRTIHKTAHKGPAILFLTLPDLILCESYHAIAKRFTTEHKIDYGLDDPFFISSNGGPVRFINFQHFRHVTGFTDFKSHDARRLFATWCLNQNSLQLAEFAAFASSHSQQVQQATYLGVQSQRLKAIVANQYYSSRTTPHDPSAGLNPGQQYLPTAEYAAELAEDLQEMDRARWLRQLQRERTTDLLTRPKPDRVLTPDTNVSLLSLISAVGVEGSLERECGTNVLDFLMKDTACIVNDKGVSNIYATLIKTHFDECFFQMVFENLLQYF